MRIRDSLHNDRLPTTYNTNSCNDLEPFRRLEGHVSAQVCVIGGGFTGVSTAIELAERGFDVALLEQNRVGWGASGRSAGQILAGPTNFRDYEDTFGSENAHEAWRMSAEGVGIIRERVAKYAIDCDLEWGGIEIARTPSEDARLQAKLASLKYHNISSTAEYLDASAIKKYIRSDLIMGGLRRTDWGKCHPLNLVRAAARAAETLGAKIYEDARVTKVSYGDTIVVDTGHGKVTADTLVFAGGAYLGKLAPKLRRKFHKVGAYMMATEPLTKDQVAAVLPQRYALRTQGSPAIFCHLSKDNRLLFGTLNLTSGRHPRNLSKFLKPYLTALLPPLQQMAISDSWGGFVGVGDTNIPQIGQLNNNVYYAQAYTGRGDADSHLCGRIIAEAIEGNDRRFTILKNVNHMDVAQPGIVRRGIATVANLFGSGNYRPK